MIKKEFSNIFHSKSIMLLIVAIVLIPFVYSFCFLTSAWDPYGNTGKVPIAVVNHDKPTHLQGKLVNVGAQTVAKLRKDNQLGWHIVSAKEAAKGLKDNKYYTVVTIPENFSKNAATVLNLHPKQMKLTYKTNGSLNYISEVMSQVGADKLNSQIRANVTNAFASTLFEQVGNIGKQIGTAATGATQISDGTVTLDNGVNQYTVGVSKVHNGIQTMKVAASPLSSGVKKLADGGNKLKDGTSDLVAGTSELAAGTPALVDGTKRLATGAGQLDGGLATLKSNIPTLGSGVQQLDNGGSQIYDGIGQINSQINGKGDSDLRGGVSQLATGSKQLTAALKTFNGETPTLTKGAQDLYTALHTLKTSAVDDQQLEAKVVKLNSTVNSAVSSLKMAYSLAGGTFDFTNMIPGMIKLPTDFKWTDRDKAKATADKETASITDMQSTIDSLDDTISKTTDDATKTALTATKKDLQTKLDKIKAASKATTTSLNNSESLLDVVYWQMTDTGKDDAGDPTGLQAAVNKLEAGLTTKQKDPTGQNKDGVDFAEALTALDAGAKELNDGVNKATGGNPKLADAVQQMYSGSAQITTGLNTLSAKANKLSPGVTQLLAGSGLLADGLDELNGQVPTLSSGVNQLADGAGQLDTGSQQLVAGATKLNNGATKLNNGSKQLDTGAGQLSDGLNELNSKVPALIDGVNQLSDGTTQLTDNSGALTDGTSQLKDGSKKLADGLTDGYKQVNNVKLTKATAKMFAEPSKDVQKRMTTVPNYGAALAPYVLALALFIAIIIFNFTYPMRRHDGYKSVAEWFKAKIAVGTLVALAMALIEATLMLVVGLPIDHLAQFYGMTILFALSAMYLTQMLNLAFGGVGIFVALGLLTMSGSGGLFPAETISPLYETFQKFLPMTYAINGFRNAITSGIASATVAESVVILIVIGLVSIALMFPAIKYLMTKLDIEPTQK